MDDPSLHTWVLCSQNGSVKTAQCTCMVGTTEAYSHVALYLLKKVPILKNLHYLSQTPVLMDSPEKE